MSKELMTSLFYKWIGYMDNADCCDEEKCIYFSSKKYHAQAQFYEELNSVELSINDKITGDNLFYLHFEMIDMKITKENILTFFRFLKDKDITQEEVEDIHIVPMKILLSCSTGMTSTYFANKMQEVFHQNHQNVIVDAVSVFEIEKVQNYYDLILIAPQVSYTYLKLKEKFGHKVMKIDTMDYASCNIKNVIHNLVS